MKNEHIWRDKTEDGEKCEIRATKFGKEWTIARRVPSLIGWTKIPNPSLELVEELLKIVKNKYQRRRLAYEDVVQVEKWVKDLGGEA